MKYSVQNSLNSFIVIIVFHVFLSRQVSEAVACAKLYDMKDLAVNYNVLGIDEGQFVSFPYQ